MQRERGRKLTVFIRLELLGVGHVLGSDTEYVRRCEMT
jgi:hypothetical protein